MIDPTITQFIFDSIIFGRVATWFSGTFGWITSFDPEVSVECLDLFTSRKDRAIEFRPASATKIENIKPYFIGMGKSKGTSLPESCVKEKKLQIFEFTPLHTPIVKKGAKMVPFAGWEMPVWVYSVVEEHLAAGKLPVCSMFAYGCLPSRRAGCQCFP